MSRLLRVYWQLSEFTAFLKSVCRQTALLRGEHTQSESKVFLFVFHHNTACNWAALSLGSGTRVRPIQAGTSDAPIRIGGVAPSGTGTPAISRFAEAKSRRITTPGHRGHFFGNRFLFPGLYCYAQTRHYAATTQSGLPLSRYHCERRARHRIIHIVHRHQQRTGSPCARFIGDTGPVRRLRRQD